MYLFVIITRFPFLSFSISQLYFEINNYSDSRRYDDALRVDSTVKSWVLAGFIIGLLVVVFYVFGIL